MPTLTPIDYQPDFGEFYEATGADKLAFEPQAKLIAKDLFNLEPRAFNPTLNFKPEGLVEGLKELGKSFMEGFNKSGGAMLKSYAEALENQYVPEGAVKFDDEGKYYDKDGKELLVQRRPNLLPVTRAAKEGEGWFGSNFEGAMPALADVWNTLGGAGGKATLGAGPSLRPALKYMDKIYKAKPGEQHLDAIPAELRATFEKQALSGEDISNFNFGFINHKGHFLQREDALKYAIDHGILDPNDAKYGTLVTTMLNQSGGGQKLASQAVNALNDIAKKAKDHFGLTNDISEAGYVLPDGSLLDLTGRHYSGGYIKDNKGFWKLGPNEKQDYLKGTRSVDHRELDFMDEGGTEGMRKFMNEGKALRLNPGTGFDTTFIPTDKQLIKVISSHNTNYRGEPFNVDLSNPLTGENLASKTFDKPNVQSVKKWIEKETKKHPTLFAESGGEGKLASQAAASQRSPTVKLNTLDKFLTENNIPFKKENSNSIGSLSTYYYIKTPNNGIKKLRVSDHIGNVGEDYNFYLGSDAEKSFKIISKEMGLEYKSEMMDKYKSSMRNDIENRIKELEKEHGTQRKNPWGEIVTLDNTDTINRFKKQLELYSDTGTEGKIASTFFSALEDNLNKIKQNKASGDQWLATLQNSKGVKGEEIEWTGLKDFLSGKKNVTKGEIEDFLKENSVNINDVWRGEMKFDKKSKYAIPEVIRAAKEASDTPGDLHLTLANDGNAYRALMKKFPELNGNEDWAEVVAKSVFGGDSMPKGTAKYEKYQLPGGENYRELLMTLPPKTSVEGDAVANFAKAAREAYGERWTTTAPETIRQQYDELIARQERLGREAAENQNYRSSHWDEPNILAHMRMNDRTIDGKKSLHLEEIQSDWHQQGREKGYKQKDFEAEIEKAKEAKDKAYDNFLNTREDSPDFEQAAKNFEAAKQKLNELRLQRDNGVPDAPFKKTWHELALKRAIREAAENGYERLSWTPGEAQAARYDLSKQVDKIAVPMVNQDGTRSVRIDAKQGTPFKLMVNKEGIVDGSHSASQFSSKPLSDVVGKEMAEKIMKLNKPDEFSGDGLKVGGEGMKGFYDQIIPKSIEKIAKEFGVKVQKGEVGSNKIPENFDIENTGGGWRVVDMNQNEGQGTFIGPIHRSGADAKKWLKEQGHLKQPIFYIDIPPAMRKSVMNKGQPLFSGTSLVPVSYIPEFEDDK